jgi:hypothetical protein
MQEYNKLVREGKIKPDDPFFYTPEQMERDADQIKFNINWTKVFQIPESTIQLEPVYGTKITFSNEIPQISKLFTIIDEKNTLSQNQINEPILLFKNVPTLYMYEQIDESSFLFATKNEYNFKMIDEELMKKKIDRIKYIPQLTEQLNIALKHNEAALLSAEEDGEVMDVGAIYLENQRIKKEIISIKNELTQLKLVENDTIWKTFKIHPRIILKVVYNILDGKLFLLLKKNEVNVATIDKNGWKMK